MRHARLGATLAHDGAYFSLFSEHAERVELCLFDDALRERRVPMTRDGDEWRAFGRGARAGTRYGFRVSGPFAPARGDRFNANKLCVDPYARAFDGKIDYRGAVFGSAPDSDVPDANDDAAFVPKSLVVDDAFDWRGDATPKTPWNESVIYELHVRGFTKRHPEVAPEHRGTYLGVASDAAIEHLSALGVTAVELMPVHECLDEWVVAKRGMHNYWGYSTLGFFAPDQRFASRAGAQVAEFKEMVRRLHAAKIEVILDVVFNHSCEGDHLGPTVSLRGIDNRAYYKLRSDDKSKYVDFTGCGNTLDVSHPYSVRLVCDSLRYWAEEMHVDGFRFDLAPALGREQDAFSARAPLFHAIFQDPSLARMKLIAEPWDVAHDAMQLGKFPQPWREWNAKFRDDVRRYWNDRTRTVGDLATRLSGSSDLFSVPGPTASINFVTAHDGFTLRDLVSYSEKHNEANGEAGRDGNEQNDSVNFGVEGETADRAIAEARLRHVRNFLATLILAPGVPMVTAGDEMFRTQGGNNNAYVLDDETSWLDWTLDDDAREILEFSRALVSLRKNQSLSRRTIFFRGGAPGTDKDVTWFRADGTEMIGDDWSSDAGALGAWFSSPGEDLVLLANASDVAIPFSLPPLLASHVSALEPLVDTRAARIPFSELPVRSERSYPLAARSLALLRAIT